MNPITCAKGIDRAPLAMILHAFERAPTREEAVMEKWKPKGAVTKREEARMHVHVAAPMVRPSAPTQAY